MRSALIFIALTITACNNSAQDKELAELRAKVAKMEGGGEQKPSLAAANKPAPAIVAPAASPKVEAATPTEEQLTPARMWGMRIKKASTDKAEFAQLFIDSQSPENKKMTYALLKKNPDRFAGRVWKFTGRIVEVSEKDGNSFARIALDYYQNNIMFVLAIGESDFVENSVVDIIGIITGSYSYTSQAGWNISIPSMIATGLLPRGELAKLEKALKGPGAKKTDEDNE